MKLVVIAIGGGLGALARYGLSGLVQGRGASFPWGTLAVNALGCLLIGAVFERLSADARAFVVVGVLGGFTTIVVAAVEVGKTRLGDLRLAKAADYTARSLAGFVRRNVDREATLSTDGWRAYQVLEREGYARRKLISSDAERKSDLDLAAVHLVFSNLKTWLTGCFHGVSAKYLTAYLAEFTYRFNRRRSPPDLFGWVVRRLCHRPPRTLVDIQVAGASA
jgi:protein CrcB